MSDHRKRGHSRLADPAVAQVFNSNTFQRVADEHGEIQRGRPRRDDRIRALRADGWTLREIAAEAGVAYEQYMVRQARERRDDRIRALRADGWTLREIAAEVGCSVATVYRVGSWL
jgi:lambda repressor-like predicted transcriptional regulator